MLKIKGNFPLFSKNAGLRILLELLTDFELFSVRSYTKFPSYSERNLSSFEETARHDFRFFLADNRTVRWILGLLFILVKEINKYGISLGNQFKHNV